MRGRFVTRCVAAVAFGVVAGLTLLPGSWFWRAVGGTRCLACGNLDALEAIHNFMLFVPVGAVLGILMGGWRRAALTACMMSLGIELLQMGIPTRDPSFEDFAMNSAGGILGAVVAAGRAVWLSPRAGVAHRWSLSAGLVFVGILAGTGFLVGPAATPVRDLFGQWAPPRPGFDPFRGRVLGLEVNGIWVPHGPIQNQAEMRSVWASRPVVVRLEVLAPDPDGLRPVLLARLMGKDGEAILLAQRRDGFIARVGLRATELGLRSLWVSVPAPPGPSDRVLLEVVMGRGAVEARAMTSSGTTSGRVALDVALGWAFLLPIEVAVGRWTHAASAIWLGLLALPVGFFMAAAVRRRPGGPAATWILAAALPVSLLAAGLGLVPLAVSAAPSHWSAWLGVACGVAAGWLAQFRVARGRGGWRTAPGPPSL